jgi:hypothetical protein
MTQFLGYAVCFLFEEEGVEWSVYVNEAGVLVTQEPNVTHFQYGNYDDFLEAFPDMAEEIRLITIKKMQDTIMAMTEVQ